MGKKKKRKILKADYFKTFPISIDEKIGILADTHFGSIYAAREHLNDFYKELYSEGVKQFFHAGDLTDGEIYKGQVAEQDAIGFDSQKELVVKEYPRIKSSKTYFITGNHDLSYLKTAGADIGEAIEKDRSDMIYLGREYCKIRDLDKEMDMDLVHLKRGLAYAMSYPLQKYMRDQPNIRKPDILIAGHRHRSWYGLIGDTHSFEAGNFQYPTPYCIRRGEGNRIAGWMVNIKKTKRKTKLKIELIDYGWG